MTTLITTVVNTPSAEIASKTFVAATYLPITGATTGATSQAQTFTNGVNLSNLTPGRIPYASTAGLLVDSSTLTYSATTGLATTKPVTITGSTDAVQFKILGNATQTNHILDVFASDGTTARFHITGDGKVGIGTTAPTAYLNIKAGTATAGTAAGP